MTKYFCDYLLSQSEIIENEKQKFMNLQVHHPARKQGFLNQTLMVQNTFRDAVEWAQG